jgi:hypothetical protein
MRGYHVEHNLLLKTEFDRDNNMFVQRPVRHPFLQQLDPLDAQRARDCGLDISALELGMLRLAAE